MRPFPPRRILVPMDMSPASARAWRVGQGLASSFGSSVEALYVQDLSKYDAEQPSMGLVAKLKSQALKALGAQTGQKTALWVEGVAEQEIARVSRGHDLVIMGNPSRRPLERLVSGSVSEGVLRSATVPVLVMRGSARRARSLLVPVNFTPYARKTFVYAAGVAAAMKVPLTALYVGRTGKIDPQRRFEALRARLPEGLRAFCKPDLKVVEGNAVDQILKEARHHGLVVLAAHRKSLLGDWLLGTTAERVSRRSPVPVLAVPAGR